MNGFKLFMVTSFACVLVLSLGGMASGTVMDSSAFAWKYEFEGATANTPDNLDIDGNGHSPDMLLYGTNPGSVSEGVMRFVTEAGGNYGAYIDDPDWKPALMDGIWTSHLPSITEGFTIEARIKAVSNSNPAALYGVTGIAAGAGGTTTLPNEGQMAIGTTSTKWIGAGGITTYAGDNTDDFHVFRMAMNPANRLFTLWRDGVKLGDNLDPVWTGYIPSRLYMGDHTGELGGTSDWDYFRFTPGYFAPVPEPGTLSLLVVSTVSLLAYAWRRRK